MSGLCFWARDPDTYARTFKPTSPVDRSVGMSFGMFQGEELFNELGVEWKSSNGEDAGAAVVPSFPLLSRLCDITSDATYQPGGMDAGYKHRVGVRRTT